MADSERGPADPNPETSREARPEDARVPPRWPHERGEGEARAERIASTAPERTPTREDRDTSYDAPEKPGSSGRTGER